MRLPSDPDNQGIPMRRDHEAEARHLLQHGASLRQKSSTFFRQGSVESAKKQPHDCVLVNHSALRINALSVKRIERHGRTLTNCEATGSDERLQRFACYLKIRGPYLPVSLRHFDFVRTLTLSLTLSPATSGTRFGRNGLGPTLLVSSPHAHARAASTSPPAWSCSNAKARMVSSSA